MFLSEVPFYGTVPSFLSATDDRLSFSSISALNPKVVLEPLEVKIGRSIVIKNLTSILEPHSNESHPKFQQLCGDFLIFLMSIMEEINIESEKYSDEGYGRQGSRMAFHRPKAIEADFKKVLNDPQNNDFLFVLDEKTGEIMGSISLIQCENGLPEISDFYLSKKLRREVKSPKVGLAKYLFSRMLSFVNNLGLKEVFLTSRRKGGFEQALNLYAQFGFKEVTKAEDINLLVRPEYQSARTIPMLLSNL